MALQGHCAPLFLADRKLLYPNACMHMQLVTTLWHSHEPQTSGGSSLWRLTYLS